MTGERSGDASVNRIVLSGRLTADPAIRIVGNNKAVTCTMRLAIQRRRTANVDRGAVFVDVTTFDRQAQNCAKFLRKGARVAIDGRLEFSPWKVDDGRMRSKHEVIAKEVEFLDLAKAAAPEPQPTPQDQPADSQDAAGDEQNTGFETRVGMAYADETPATPSPPDPTTGPRPRSGARPPIPTTRSDTPVTKTTAPIGLASLPDIRIGEDAHATIERDTKGNPVLVLIAPLELDDNDEYPDAQHDRAHRAHDP